MGDWARDAAELDRRLGRTPVSEPVPEPAPEAVTVPPGGSLATNYTVSTDHNGFTTVTDLRSEGTMGLAPPVQPETKKYGCAPPHGVLWSWVVPPPPSSGPWVTVPMKNPALFSQVAGSWLDELRRQYEPSDTGFLSKADLEKAGTMIAQAGDDRVDMVPCKFLVLDSISESEGGTGSGVREGLIPKATLERVRGVIDSLRAGRTVRHRVGPTGAGMREAAYRGWWHRNAMLDLNVKLAATYAPPYPDADRARRDRADALAMAGYAIGYTAYDVARTSAFIGGVFHAADLTELAAPRDPLTVTVDGLTAHGTVTQYGAAEAAGGE